MVDKIILKPIGVVHTPFSEEEVKNSLSGVEGVIEIFKEFGEGLDGIDGFSHLIVTAFLKEVSEKQREVLRVRFRRFIKFGAKLEELPEVGVFCSDSPHRPNPIAITIVELVKREGCLLHVKGLDLFDGTPVLDLKPYTPSRIIKEIRLPTWYKKLEEKMAKLPGIRDPSRNSGCMQAVPCHSLCWVY